MSKYFDLSAIHLNKDGRAILDEKSIALIESVETNVTKAGGMNYGYDCDFEPTTNFDCNGPGTNRPSCSNGANCGGSQNQLSCENDIGCGQTANQNSCANPANCIESTNRSCTNQFTSGCSGSTNSGGPTVPCG